MREIMAQAPHIFQPLSEAEIQLLLDHQETHQAWMIVDYLVHSPIHQNQHQPWVEQISELLNTLKHNRTHGEAINPELRDEFKQQVLSLLAGPTMLDTQEMQAVILDEEDEELLDSDFDDTRYALDPDEEEAFIQNIEELEGWTELFGSNLPEDIRMRGEFLYSFRLIVASMEEILFENELNAIDSIFDLIDKLGTLEVREILDFIRNRNPDSGEVGQVFMPLLSIYCYKEIGDQFMPASFLNSIYDYSQKMIDIHYKNPSATIMSLTMPQIANSLYKVKFSN